MGPILCENIFFYFAEKIKRLEGLLTKCKESIKANKQKTTALTEVKESLAKQVEEKEIELNDVKSQLLNNQSILSSTQIELSSLRSKGQQEELQIAEIKMMMHQVQYDQQHITCRTVIERFGPQPQP